MAELYMLNGDCCACLARDLGGGPEVATLVLLHTLDLVPREQIERDMCFAHRRELEKARGSHHA